MRAPLCSRPEDARCRRPAATAPVTRWRGARPQCVETTPALAPLLLDGDRHAALAGVSHRVRLTIRGDDGRPINLEGALLWTHFGASGPVVLNASRHWHRAQLEGRARGRAAEPLSRRTIRVARGVAARSGVARPRAQVATVLAARMPAAVADAWTTGVDLENVTISHLTRDSRRSLIHALLATPLEVRDSRGYKVRGGHGRRHSARRNRSGADGIALLSGSVPGGRNPGRGWPPGRLQFSVGVVVGVGGGAGDCRSSSFALISAPKLC